MGLVFACIAPHGAEVIPELAGAIYDAFAETRRGMEELGQLAKQKNVDTVILATPHGLRLEATIGIVTTEFSEGSLEANGKSVRLKCGCNRDLAKKILESAHEAGLPVVGVNYGTSEGPASCMPMDWGTLIPLWFLAGPDSTTKIVILTPSREMPLDTLVKFGHAVFQAASSSKERIAFVASADQGHAHKADGPYGFHQASEEFDRRVKQAVLENDLKSVLDLSAGFVEDAKPDSPWQLAILQGILDRIHMRSRFLSYQVPTYFGMLCAAYEPTNDDHVFSTDGQKRRKLTSRSKSAHALQCAFC